MGKSKMKTPAWINRLKRKKEPSLQEEVLALKKKVEEIEVITHTVTVEIDKIPETVMAELVKSMEEGKIVQIIRRERLMETIETIHPFILVRPKKERSSYRENIIIQTDQGPMLAARVERYMNEIQAGVRTILLTIDEIEMEP